MRVAILGAGNGGIASAFDFAQHGHEVALYAPPEFGHNLMPIADAGGITATGDLEGFAPVRYAGNDLGEAIDGVELVVIVGPAYATEPHAFLAGPHLKEGMAVLICPGSCAGAIAFKRSAGFELDDERYIVGETSTLPYAVRITAPATINVFLKLETGVYLAGLPRAGTDRLYELVKDVWPAVEKAESVFQTTLQNGNPVIHPAVTLLNAALLERTGGDFLFYEEGVTESVGRMIEAVDNERLAIAAALGVTIESEPEIGIRQGYMTENNYSTAYSKAPGFLGIKAQPQLDHRYLTEDVGYSLCLLADLARVLDVPTPVMDAVITMTSVVLDRDLRREAVRTVSRSASMACPLRKSPPCSLRRSSLARDQPIRRLCISAHASPGHRTIRSPRSSSPASRSSTTSSGSSPSSCSPRPSPARVKRPRARSPRRSPTSACPGSSARARRTWTSRASSWSPCARCRSRPRASCSKSQPTSPSTTCSCWRCAKRARPASGSRSTASAPTPTSEALLDLADTVKLDISRTDEEAIEAAVNVARGRGLTLIADGVQTRSRLRLLPWPGLRRLPGPLLRRADRHHRRVGTDLPPRRAVAARPGREHLLRAARARDRRGSGPQPEARQARELGLLQPPSSRRLDPPGADGARLGRRPALGDAARPRRRQRPPEPPARARPAARPPVRARRRPHR